MRPANVEFSGTPAALSPEAPLERRVGPNNGCICRGNWRNIVSECENLFQKKFADRDGQEWTFFGVVWGEDDFYYGMWRDDGKVSLLSCVGSIEGYGFTPVRPNVEFSGQAAASSPRSSAGTQG